MFQVSLISLPQIAYKGIPVVTTESLAQAYEVEEYQVRQNFKNNKDRFVEGKHLFSLSGNELREFKRSVENFYSVPKNVNALTLWIERGAARHAKMLNSDRAWDVFELLEETFFAVAKPAQTASYPDLPLTPDQQCTIQALVKAKVDAVPAKLRHNGLYPQIYKRFNNHFRIGSYKQLLQSMMNEGIAYLVQMEVYTGKEEREEKRELPPSQPQFPSGIVSNIPGPQPGDKYYAYLEKVERWRVATVAERKKLYREGVALLDVERTGGQIFHVCADFLTQWLNNEVLSSNTSVFDELLSHNRAPVVLIKFLNTNFEDVRKYLK